MSSNKDSESVNLVHPVRYSVAKMLEQLVEVKKTLHDAWPPPPAQSNAPPPTKSSIAAQGFARELGENATVDNAVALLQEDTLGAASFLDAAYEALKAENPKPKVSFDIQTQQETMELGHLCAFVDFRLSNMLRAKAPNR